MVCVAAKGVGRIRLDKKVKGKNKINNFFFKGHYEISEKIGEGVIPDSFSLTLLTLGKILLTTDFVANCHG